MDGEVKVPEKVTVSTKVLKLGRLIFEMNSKVVDANFKSMIKHCEPRPVKKQIVVKKQRTPWVFSASIWNTIWDYDYQDDLKVIFLLTTKDSP